MTDVEERVGHNLVTASETKAPSTSLGTDHKDDDKVRSTS